MSCELAVDYTYLLLLFESIIGLKASLEKYQQVVTELMLKFDVSKPLYICFGPSYIGYLP